MSRSASALAGPGGSLPLAPPAGMGDLLMPESLARRELGRQVVDGFARWGYDLVSTPPFEHAEVLERGLDAVDRRDLLRFVEPETGEVALLRPDITPQIARIVATRLRDHPPPFRLCYFGTVVRRRRGRARRQRQIAQAGVECIGWSGPNADAEVIELAARACESVGLSGYRIELGQVRIGQAAIDTLPEGIRGPAAEALMQKDRAALESLLQRAGVPIRDRGHLLALPDLYGDVSVIRQARRRIRSPAAVRALDELEAVAERLSSAGLGGSLGVDLGELRGQAYYTGVSFTVLAEGPGEPVGGGGRYDGLLERFGDPSAATGFALDLGNLEWALLRAGRAFRAELPLRIAMAGKIDRSLANVLRAGGVTAAWLEEANARDALAFAGAWKYDAVLVGVRNGVRAVRVADGSSRAFEANAPAALDELYSWARACGTSSEEVGWR